MKTPVKVAIATILSFILVFVVLWQTNIFGTQVKVKPKPKVSVEKQEAPKEILGPLETQALEQKCDLTPEALDTPTLVELVNQKKSLPLLSLGYDETQNSPKVPPLEERFTVAWYNEGPKVGSDKGKILITGHTYPEGEGIGNSLNQGLLKAGDLIKVTDKEGNTACYRYREEKHIFVSEYDPDSDLVYDEQGKPQLMFFVCDNYVGHGEWDGRRMYLADLLTETNVKEYDKQNGEK